MIPWTGNILCKILCLLQILIRVRYCLILLLFLVLNVFYLGNSLDIDTKNNAIQTQKEIIEDCDKNIKELEQYLRDNFEVCDVCGNVK